MSDEVAAHAWKIFPWESFVVNGELKSFSKWLRPLANIPKSVIYLSSIRCLSWLLRRHLYFFVNRARNYDQLCTAHPKRLFGILNIMDYSLRTSLNR